MIPDNLTVYVAVLGMAMLTLLVASLFSSYQRAQAHKRLLIQQLQLGVQRNESLLMRLAPVSLPREIRLALRRDTFDRYRRIKALNRRNPGIDNLLAQSEERLNSEGGDTGPKTPVPADTAVFERWQKGFNELMQLVQGGRLSRPIAGEARHKLVVAILERQAESIFAHHMNQADEMKADGRLPMARRQIQQATEWIRALGVHTDRVEALLKQADEAYQYLLTGEAPTPSEEKYSA